MTLIDMSGARLGRLTITSRATDSRAGHVMWSAICACGTTIVVDGRNLRSGHTQSCGCLLRDILLARATHGHTVGGDYSPEFKSWVSMLNRCLNANEPAYPRYGGRGISICERWTVFENFYADMGPKPSKNYSIDRYPNNDGDYEPSNCRWATRKQQARNRRSTFKVLYQGKEMSLAEASEQSGIPYDTAKQRIRKLKWSHEKTFSEPIRG